MSTPSNAHARYQYVLGDSSREAVRLEQQAALWDPYAAALFDRLGVTEGWRVLEVGPGRGSVHMELRRRVRGPIDAIERSAAFADAVRRRTQADGFGEGQIWQTDLLSAEIPRASYDLVYARWVFCFLPEPGRHLERLVGALKPGGRIALQDYAHRESFALFPRPHEWLDFLDADRAMFAAYGGDISIAGRLPGLYSEAGLDLVDVTPILLSGAPGSAVWEWLSGYFDSVRERLADIPPLDRRKTMRLAEHWSSIARDPRAFVVAPAMADVVGRKT